MKGRKRTSVDSINRCRIIRVVVVWIPSRSSSPTHWETSTWTLVSTTCGAKATTEKDPNPKEQSSDPVAAARKSNTQNSNTNIMDPHRRRRWKGTRIS